MLTKICKKLKSSLSFSYENIYYRKNKPEAGQSMCAAMNVFFHLRKLINFTMSLSEFCMRKVLLTGRKYAYINLSDVKNY